mmetsp:Transcript_128929/g.321595  ORF Transcript_128929/g.321595 Transcript_128929/m.321595 type:complete len:99 (+) Transcript_128929:2350-2646(+)
MAMSCQRTSDVRDKVVQGFLVMHIGCSLPLPRHNMQRVCRLLGTINIACSCSSPAPCCQQEHQHPVTARQTSFYVRSSAFLWPLAHPATLRRLRHGSF